MTCHLHRFWWWLGLEKTQHTPHRKIQCFCVSKGPFSDSMAPFFGGSSDFFFWQVNYPALVWALVVSSQCKSVVSLSSTGTLHPAPRHGGWLGSTLRLLSLQPITPLRLMQANVGVDKNPAKVCSVDIWCIHFLKERNTNITFTLTTVKQCLGRTSRPLVYGVGRCICRYIEGTLSIGYAIEHGNISCLGGGFKYFIFFLKKITPT